MKKYHYTSEENTKKIMVEGMKPYPFDRAKVEAIEEQMGPWVGKGIFLWDSELTPEEELGSLIWQLASKGSYRICKLEIEIKEEDTLHSDWGGKVQMYHYQTISANTVIGAEPHKGVPASVGTIVIPPKNIRIVKTYNMMDIVRSPQ